MIIQNIEPLTFQDFNNVLEHRRDMNQKLII